MTERHDHIIRENAAGPSSALGEGLDESRRAALALLAPDASSAEQEHAITWIHAQPALQVAQGFVSDQVDQLLFDAASASGLIARLPAKLVEMLSTRRLQAIANVIRQEHVLGEACALLQEIDVEQVVFKGALLRTILYAKPHLRPSVDVDLLVGAGDAPRVARALGRRGYRLVIDGHSDTHEISLERHGVLLDLHWCLLRPGRMRQDITQEVLDSRVQHGSLWSPNDAHMTVAMLVHPAISDHVSGSFIAAVDLDLWLRKLQVPWAEVVAILRRIGLRTAAWAMLAWTHALFDTPVPEEVWRELTPSPLRKRYLETWLRHHPARLYFRQPWLVRGAFSLALQDRASDAVRALWMLARKKRLSL